MPEVSTSLIFERIGLFFFLTIPFLVSESEGRERQEAPEFQLFLPERLVWKPSLLVLIGIHYPRQGQPSSALVTGVPRMVIATPASSAEPLLRFLARFLLGRSDPATLRSPELREWEAQNTPAGHRRDGKYSCAYFCPFFHSGPVLPFWDLVPCRELRFNTSWRMAPHSFHSVFPGPAWPPSWAWEGRCGVLGDRLPPAGSVCEPTSRTHDYGPTRSSVTLTWAPWPDAILCGILSLWIGSSRSPPLPGMILSSHPCHT